MGYRIIRPRGFPGFPSRARQIRQRVQRSRQLPASGVSVCVHGQVDGAMPEQLLCGLGMHVTRRQTGSELVPQGVEIEYAPGVVSPSS